MSLVKPRTMPGTLELLPREQIAFQRMLDRVRHSYERFGFLPLETPAMEFLDVLLTKSGGETEKQVYLVQSTGARSQGREPDLGLRFDLTVPLARYVAEHQNQLMFPFRRYQMQNVYRGESAQRGRYREFLQCDIDVVGREDLPLLFDAEIPVVIYHTFQALNVGGFTIQVNNRKVLKGYLEHLGVTDAGQQGLVLREIDKLDKKGRDDVARGLSSDKVGLDADVAARLLDFLHQEGSNAEILRSLQGFSTSHETLREGIHELTQVVEGMGDLGLPEEFGRIRLAIARGLDYYTGTVYETVLNEHPEIGSVCSGGRYENLAGQYTKTHLPGVGISLGASRLFYQLRELGLIESDRSSVDVLVTQFDANLVRESRRLASLLREAGIPTQLYHEVAKMGKQMKYADRAGIPLVVIMGEAEHARDCVQLKHMKTGEQKEVSREAMAQEVRGLLGTP